MVSDFGFTFREAWKVTFREFLMLSNFKQKQIKGIRDETETPLDAEYFLEMEEDLKERGVI